MIRAFNPLYGKRHRQPRLEGRKRQTDLDQESDFRSESLEIDLESMQLHLVKKVSVEVESGKVEWDDHRVKADDTAA